MYILGAIYLLGSLIFGGRTLYLMIWDHDFVPPYLFLIFLMWPFMALVALWEAIGEMV